MIREKRKDTRRFCAVSSVNVPNSSHESVRTDEDSSNIDVKSLSRILFQKSIEVSLKDGRIRYETWRISARGEEVQSKT
jgi:hypothetical protein